MKPCCDVCLGLDRRSVEDDRWVQVIKGDLTAEHTLLFESSKLHASAESGCETCSIVSRGLELIGRDFSLFDVSLAYRGIFILQAERPLEVEIFEEKEEEEEEEEEEAEANACTRFQFYTLPGNDCEGKGKSFDGPFSAANDVPPELSVERCSSIIANWIETCRVSHEACSAAKPDANELPHRLLDLRQREGAAVVLVESRNNAECHVEQYATLSHCWGRTHVIQTTRQNLALRMQGVEWDHLPKTFQDAITIVRALHIQFLWIDSLCIVQDDMLDWNEESVRMAVIYSNSYINIAATGAADSCGGCLYPRSLKHLVPTCQVKSLAISNPEDSEALTIFVRPSLERVHQRYSTHRSHEFDLPDSQTVPLLSRAWVFQERNLAPRTLHFHPSEMVMECKSSVRCECSGLDKVAPKTRRRSLHLESTDRADIFNSWLEVVEEYSKLRLSRKSDRLPALTGVATVFQKKLGCGYMAGIWTDDVARGILWDVTRYALLERSVCRNGSAPTWSWASLLLDLDGSGIVFPAGHDDTFQIDDRFRFLETDIPFAATDFSLVTPKMESIWLRGVAVTATAHPNSSDDFTWKDLVIVFDEEIEDIVLITMTAMNIDCTWKSPNACPLAAGSTVYCLLVGTKIYVDWNSKKQTRYQCTLVLKASPRDTQRLERIGVMNIEEHLGIFHTATDSSFQLV